MIKIYQQRANIPLAFLTISSISLLSLVGCSSLYSPNVPASPMFKNRGEAYVAGNIDFRTQIAVSAGVAVTDHVAIIGNASTVSKDEGNAVNKQKLAEIGVGYFTTFGDNKRQVLEVYGGYGRGNFQEQQLRSSTTGFALVDDVKADFKKYFVQVNFSSTKRDKIKLFGEEQELSYGTMLRLNQLTMHNTMHNAMPEANERNFFLEPVFFTRLGLTKSLQLQYTTGMNIGLQKNEYLKAGHPIFSFGILYNFGRTIN